MHGLSCRMGKGSGRIEIKGIGLKENEWLAPRPERTASTAGAVGITTLTTRLFLTGTTTTRTTATTTWVSVWFVPAQLFLLRQDFSVIRVKIFRTGHFLHSRFCGVRLFFADLVLVAAFWGKCTGARERSRPAFF